MGWLVPSVHVVGMGVLELGYVVHKSIGKQVLGLQSKGVLDPLKIWNKYKTYCLKRPLNKFLIIHPAQGSKHFRLLTLQQTVS